MQRSWTKWINQVKKEVKAQAWLPAASELCSQARTPNTSTALMKIGPSENNRMLGRMIDSYLLGDMSTAACKEPLTNYDNLTPGARRLFDPLVGEPAAPASTMSPHAPARSPPRPRQQLPPSQH
ncbi:hypothetical protein QYE76_049625 [Lolium multiflorum]|uniref:Uncharacterized protein n=1 Tax=Lolium multiflorum TaxID=4521 RepID=A0AAD8WH24_LOLMU|nr:hypothetical protein QYE76_049625 [Lolium multiflorum]